MIFLLVFVMNFGVMACDDNNVTPNESKLVESLRRQLIQDNYDYQPSEDELPLLRHRDRDPPGDRPHHPTATNWLHDRPVHPTTTGWPHHRHNHPITTEWAHHDRPYHPTTTEWAHHNRPYHPKMIEKQRSNQQHQYFDHFSPLKTANDATVDDDTIQFGADILNNEQSRRNYAIAEKDAKEAVNNFKNNLYSIYIKENKMPIETNAGPQTTEGNIFNYIDDERLKEAKSDDDWSQDDEPAAETTTTAKYKLIKVKGEQSRRRGGGGGRFVQEQRADGVAIMSVDGAPFPLLRLPSARRQYMTSHSDEIEAGRGTPDDLGSFGSLADLENHDSDDEIPS